MCMKLICYKPSETWKLSCVMRLWLFLVLATGTECTHIFTLDKDFSKLQTDSELAKDKDVAQVLKRLKTFKVAVHPRVPLLYRLLQRAVRRYAHRTAHALHVPCVYRNRDDARAVPSYE